MEGTTISGRHRLSSKNRTMSVVGAPVRVRSLRTRPSGDAHLLRTRARVFLIAALILLVTSLDMTLFSCRTITVIDPTGDQSFSDAAEEPSVALTYYSNWNLSETPVKSGDRIVGEHVVLVSSWKPTASIDRCRIEVKAQVLPTFISKDSDSASVEIDTHALNNNATCTINMTAWLINGSFISYVVPDVFIGSFFRPQVWVLSPNGGEVWTGVNRITWAASDKNLDEKLTYEVLISYDAGLTFQLLAAHLNETWFDWDSTGFLTRDTYVVMVRASDSIYTVSDVSDGTFTAGSVPTVTTTVTTTATSGTPFFAATALFATVVVISSGLMAFVVYIAAKRWL